MPWIRRILAAIVAIAVLAGCREPTSRSRRSFDEIEALVNGKTADQVLRLLGEPDSRQTVFEADERWIWWNFTYLDGRDVPPEVRGTVVHLEILFVNPTRGYGERPPYSEWQIDDTLGVSFQRPDPGR